MNLQQAPIPNSCVPTSFAMCVGIPTTVMIFKIGHTGDDIIWPGLTDPQCRRGFHVQECIDVCIQYDRAVTHIEAMPRSAPHAMNIGVVEPYLVPMSNNERMSCYLARFKGVLLGPTHAVAWNTEQVYDPKGKIYSIDELDFQITDFYVISQLI